MRIAFYAPMKPPGHPVPSGDRTMARALASALSAAGHTVLLASRFSSYDGDGDDARQRRLARVGTGLSDRLIRRWRSLPADRRPQLWFTYHLYHKAPDWLGPPIARALALPYLVAEASFAGKRLQGPWAFAAAAALDGIIAADAHLLINPADEAGLAAAGVPPSRIVPVPPFTGIARQATALDRTAARAALAERLDLPQAVPWLLAVGMFRFGDKLASYRILADALALLGSREWRLLIVGGGPAHDAVSGLFAAFPGRTRWLEGLESDTLVSVYAAADLLVWPAVNEAYGVALLEAQALGLPVVAGRAGGVAAVVADGETGLLTPPGDVDGFAAAVVSLLDDSGRRQSMGAAAARRVAARYDLAAAARRLQDAIDRFAGPGKAEP